MGISVKKLYFNPRAKASFSGLSTFLSNRLITKSKSDVEAELLRLKEYYMYRPALKKFRKMSRWQRFNKGVKFLLLFQDTFSKMIYIEALKTKAGKNVLLCVKKILKKLPRTPHYITSDLGGEFIFKPLKKLLESKNITWFTTHTHSVICERSIGTVMTRIIRYIAHKDSNTFVPALKSIVSSINSTKSTSTGFAPRDINQENYFLAFRKMFKNELQSNQPRDIPKYKVGQAVRFSLVKEVHEKGYFPRWGLEVVFIDEVRKTDPPAYYLKYKNGDRVPGVFYEPELLLAYENASTLN